MIDEYYVEGLGLFLLLAKDEQKFWRSFFMLDFFFAFLKIRRLKKGFLQKQVDSWKMENDCGGEGKKGVSEVQRDEFCLISFACD